MSGALTNDRRTLSHLKPTNLQIMVDDFHGAFRGYRFMVGLSDSFGEIVYDYMKATIGSARVTNEAGVIAFHTVQADPKGGILTLSAVRWDRAGPPESALITNSKRYGTIPAGGKLLFQVNAVTSSESDTTTDASQKTTVGGELGGNWGVASAKGTASHEWQGAGRSSTTSRDGPARGMMIQWLPK